MRQDGYERLDRQAGHGPRETMNRGAVRGAGGNFRPNATARAAAAARAGQQPAATGVDDAELLDMKIRMRMLELDQLSA